jgi:hypothetical protein
MDEKKHEYYMSLFRPTDITERAYCSFPELVKFSIQVKYRQHSRILTSSNYDTNFEYLFKKLS